MGHIGTPTTTAPETYLYYDSSDRNTGYEQYDYNGNGVGLYYDRDVQGRIIGRYKSTIANWNWTGAGDWYYHYTGSGDTPDYVRDDTWTIIEKTLQLPGGVNLTIKPTQTGNNQKQYSLPNIHGDTLLTTNAQGTNTSNGNGPLNTYTYDPFGTVVAGSTLPATTAGASYAYVGQHQKFTESAFSLTPIQMGVRVYLPSLGRFTSVDPVEGGGENSYSYPTDPVSEFDLTGEFWSWKDTKSFVSQHKVAIGIGVTIAAVAVGCAVTGGAGCVAAVVRGAAWAGNALRTSKTIQTLAKTRDVVKNGNNLLRIGKGRVSIGPSPKYYKDGRIGSKIPIHIHIDTKKILIQSAKTGKKIFCRGRCY